MPRIQASLLPQYAEVDEPANEGWPAHEAALQEHGKVYEANIYEGADHSFHNDSTPRYDTAAELAWSRMLRWLDRHLA